MPSGCEWITTIALAALTLIGLLLMIHNPWVQGFLIIVVAGAAAYALYRQFAHIKAETASRHPVAVG